VLVRRDGPEARITLNRPAQRNALSLALMRVIDALDRRPTRRPRDRLEGAGRRSARARLGEMTRRDVGFYQHVFDVCTQMMEAVHRVRQPVIARVHGIADRAGCQLVAAATSCRRRRRALRHAGREDRACSARPPMVPLSRAVGRKRSLEMLLTGAPITPPRRSTGGCSTASSRGRA